MHTTNQHNILYSSNAVACVAAILITLTLFVATADKAAANEDLCPIKINEPADIFNLALSDQITFSTFSVDASDTAGVTITNNTDCNFPVTIASYKVKNKILADQKLYHHRKATISPQSSRFLHVELPNCTAQIDILHDPNRDGPPQPPTPANPKLIGWTFQLHEDDTAKENDVFHFATSSPYNGLDNFPDEDHGYSSVPEGSLCSEGSDTLDIECDTDPDNSPSTGDTVTWKVSADGGDGSYSYKWTGDVSGTNKTETVTYTNTGQKTGKITVKSGDQKQKAQCNVDISDSGGGGSFGINHSGTNMWTISNIALPSTRTELDLNKKGGFSQQVTLKATSSQVANAETKFVHEGTKKDTLTLDPGEFGDSIELFANPNVAAGTHPVTVTAKAPSGMSASAVTPLRAQSYMEF
ncbi:MAG: hypothetical protein BRC25_00400 [Parcubacteria group bacterium SW_6_46_9]|nr:MAG: hypothetical protein BRC25_00400 [Parcubacteria group bacterium SW_6_46_9]